MTPFEFVFSLLVILLGLGLGQVLGGLASAVKRRPELEIGWGTGLLAVWVTTETVIFWEIIWRTRDVMPDNSASIFAGFGITALYYFAGALVFPDDLANRKSIDDYFMRVKAKVIGAVIAAFTVAFLLRPLVLPRSWSFLNWFDWLSIAIIYVAGAVVMVTKRRPAAIGGLALLAAIDVFSPIGYLLWGE